MSSVSLLNTITWLRICCRFTTETALGLVKATGWTVIGRHTNPVERVGFSQDGQWIISYSSPDYSKRSEKDAGFFLPSDQRKIWQSNADKSTRPPQTVNAADRYDLEVVWHASIESGETCVRSRPNIAGSPIS
jgi:hypothetical protein